MKKLLPILILLLQNFGSNSQQLIGPVLPDMAFDGNATRSLGKVTLPKDFEFSAKVMVNASNEWRHLIEVGAVEYGWNCPLRIETGNEGVWYMTVGDGNTYYELSMNGGWKYGQWMDIRVVFKEGTLTFYQDGKSIGSRLAKLDASLSGTLILGSMKGNSRWFEGEMKDAKLIDLSKVADSAPATSSCTSSQKIAKVWGLSHYQTYAGYRYDLYEEGTFYLTKTKLEAVGGRIFQIQAKTKKPAQTSFVTDVAISLGSDKLILTSENNQMAVIANGNKQIVASGQTYTCGLLNLKVIGMNEASARVEISIQGFGDFKVQSTFNRGAPATAGIGYFNIDSIANNCINNFGLFGVVATNPSADYSLKANFKDYTVPAEKSLF